MKILLTILLTLATHFATAADPVGRIFFSPEQRIQLDALRTKKAVASPVRDEPIPETVTYNGIVRRSDGKTTVWINDEALSETSLLNKQSLVGKVGRDGRILLQASQAAIQLKVGQSATVFSGKVEESFTPKNTSAEKKKTQERTETTPLPASQSASKDIPPELLEALQQAAARERDKTAVPAVKPGAQNNNEAPTAEEQRKIPLN